jgi:hypothetical protein
MTAERPTHQGNEPQPSRVGKGLEIGSRVIFGGFWALVAVGALVGGLSLMGHSPGTGLLGLLVAVLAGLYSRYIFRGGRWRIMFW